MDLDAAIPPLRPLIARGGGLARVAEAHRTAWIGAVEQVDEGEVALFVGHGGGIEWRATSQAASAMRTASAG